MQTWQSPRSDGWWPTPDSRCEFVPPTAPEQVLPKTEAGSLITRSEVNLERHDQIRLRRRNGVGFTSVRVRTKATPYPNEASTSWLREGLSATSSRGLRLGAAFARRPDRRSCTCTRRFGLLVLHERCEAAPRSLAQLLVGQRAQRLALARRHDPCRPLSVGRIRPVRGTLVQVGHEPEQRFA